MPMNTGSSPRARIAMHSNFLWAPISVRLHNRVADIAEKSVTVKSDDAEAKWTLKVDKEHAGPALEPLEDILLIFTYTVEVNK